MYIYIDVFVCVFGVERLGSMNQKVQAHAGLQQRPMNIRNYGPNSLRSKFADSNEITQGRSCVDWISECVCL